MEIPNQGDTGLRFPVDDVTEPCTSCELKGFSDFPLDIPGGDGEKTLGEAEKTFILWRKRYIIIPEMSPPPPPELPHHRCG